MAANISARCILFIKKYVGHLTFDPILGQTSKFYVSPMSESNQHDDNDDREVRWKFSFCNDCSSHDDQWSTF